MNKATFISNSVCDFTNDVISLKMDVTLGNELTMLQHLERTICRAKETLNQQVAKQKTWDQKEENQVVQQEQESSIHSNDQRLPEKEQSQKIVKTSRKQYLVSYGSGLDTEAVENLMEQVEKGNSVYYPDTVKIQVIDL